MIDTKQILKKILITSFLFSILSMYLPLFSFAENNTDGPGLDVSSINISNKNATVGDTVKISFKINNISGEVNYVDAYYTKPIVNTLTDKISFKYNIQNGLFEAEFEITDTYINGEYLFNRLMISVGDYNETYYNSENEYINDYGQVINLNAFSFTVYGTTGDDTPPKIVSSSVEISNDRAVIGDIITYKAKILENTTIKNVNLKLANQTGRYEYTYKTLNMTYNSTSGLYEANLTIDDSLLAGYWYINNIYAKDIFNNGYTLYNSQFYSSGTFTSTVGYSNLAKSTFKNFQEYPEAKLEDEGIVVENPNVTAGDNLKISMLIRDDFIIDNVKIYYNQESGNNQIILQPKFENVKYKQASSYGGVEFCVITTDNYFVNEEIGKYGCNSNWIVDRIEIQNMAGHITTFYNKQVYPYSLIDLSSGNFTTYGLIENSIEVDNENIMLDNNKKSHQIEYNVISNGISSNSAKFNSNDESIVLVSSTGFITAQGNGNTTITVTSEDNTIIKEINVTVNMNEQLPSIYTSLESSGNEDEITTIQLITNDNKEIFKIELIGNSKEFIIPSIEQGDYILRISKKSHVSRDYFITINNSNINLDTKISLMGDINGDGKVNIKDWNRLYNHINETNILTDYELLCADVNKDKKVNIKDWNRMYNHINGTYLLY